MIDTLKYKDFIGSIEYSSEDNILYGKVLGINSLILYEGKDVDSLKKDFEESVDDYLESCKKDNTIPEKSFKGSFNIRINPELHKNLACYAMKNNTSLNKVVEEALNAYYLFIKNKQNHE